MNLLIEQAAKTDGIQSNRRCSGLTSGVMWNTDRVAIRMTIQARHSQAGLSSLSIISRIELFLREWRHQQAQAIELHGCQDVFEQAVIVVDRDHFASGDVAQLGPALQKHRRRNVGQKRLGEIELDVVPLQPRKHFDLHLGEDLAA